MAVTLSVVTPSYNQARYLEETLRSVVSQRDQLHEYFVFDGGSTDGSADLIRKYAPLIDYWQSGGEPDVVGVDQTTRECIFVDCSAQSPKGRRSVCYDREALEARKEHKPKSSALEMAGAMGAALLTVDEYRGLQEVGEFDTTTSSWVQTPDKIRKLGGALFCDRRYDTVFVYHNGAESYYAARGFRCSLRV